MDLRLKKLKINLPSHWVDISNENPDGAPTFINGRLDEPGVLQISLAEYKSGEKPEATYTDLVQLSESIGLRNDFGEVRASQSGDCAFGKYAYVQFYRPDFPYISVWHLTNGKDFVFSTFICSALPSNEERDEVARILTTIKKKGFFF